MAIMGILRAAFPRPFTVKQHKKAMEKYLPRIVAAHASGNTALQQGRYASPDKLKARHEQARRALA